MFSLSIFKIRSCCSSLSPVATDELAFSLWISGIWLILNVSIRCNYCFIAQVLHLATGISLILCPFDLTLVMWIFPCFYVQQVFLSYLKNPLFLSFILQRIHKDIHIRALDSLCSMLCDAWRPLYFTVLLLLPSKEITGQ